MRLVIDASTLVAEALRARGRRLLSHPNLDLVVAVVPASAYADRLAEARRRVPQDERDAPTVALALGLDCGIWIGGRDFFGCGLPVWTTDTLVHHLEVLEMR